MRVTLMRRFLPPPSLIVATALLLVAPALAYHVSTSAATPHDLESSSLLVPSVHVTGPFGAPDGVSIVDAVTFADATGATARHEDVLVRVEVASLVPPKVTTQVRLPGDNGLTPPLTLAGVLDVTQSGDGTLVSVRDGASTPFAARLDATTGAVDATWTSPNGGRTTVRHAGSGASSVTNADGDVESFVVQDPLALVPGVPSGAAGEPLVDVRPTSNGVRVSVAGDAVTLPGADLVGDPFDADGALVLDDLGLGLLVVRATLPSTPTDPVTVGLEGPALAALFPGAESATLTLATADAPFGVAVVTIAGVTESTDRALVLAAGTGVTLLDLSNGPAGLVISDALGAVRETLETTPVTFRTERTPSGLGVIGHADGRETVALDVDREAATVLTLRHSADALAGGDADHTMLVDTATGLVASAFGTLEDPLGVILGTTTGAAFFSAQPMPGGGLAVAWPGAPGDAPVDVPAGAVTLAADPSGLAPWDARVTADGSAVASVRVERASQLAGAAGLTRPVLLVDAPVAGRAVTIAPPLALEGDLAAKRVDAVTVYDPVTPSTPLARAQAGPTGWTLETPVGTHASSATGVALPADALTADRVTFTVGDASFGVDRATGAATVSANGESETVTGPVAYAGDPTDPDAVHVADPQDPANALVRYSRDGSLMILGDEHAFNGRTVTFEGDARSRDGFALVVASPDGSIAERHHVRPRALLADMGVPASVRDPLLTMIESEHADARWLTHVTDARGNRLDHAALESATSALALVGPHSARVDVPRDLDAFTRVTLSAWRAGAADAPVHATLQRVNAADDAFVYGGAFTPPAADGGMVHVLARYETQVTPFVSRAVEETGYAYRVDGSGPRVSVSAPADSASATFTVAWAGAGEETPAAFVVEKRVDDGAWSPWLARATDESATFTGAPGVTYAFRARGVDAVGNMGTWSAPATVRVSAGADDAATGPASATLTAPAVGSTLAGVVDVAWAPLPDGALANLYASRDGGRSWKPLYSGSASGYAWDTLGERDGAWTLRLVVTVGEADAEDVLGPVTVRNTGVGQARVTEATAESGLGDGAGGSNAGGAGGAGGAGDASGAASGAGAMGGALANVALAGAGFVAVAILVVLGVVIGKRRKREP